MAQITVDAIEQSRLAAKAAAADADEPQTMQQANAGPIPEPGEVYQAARDAAEGWRAGARQFGAVVVALVPKLREAWTDEALNNLGDALNACAAHYGFASTGEVMRHPALQLLAASVPLAFPIVMPIIQARMAKPDAKPDAEPVREKVSNGKASNRVPMKTVDA